MTSPARIGGDGRAVRCLDLAGSFSAPRRSVDCTASDHTELSPPVSQCRKKGYALPRRFGIAQSRGLPKRRLSRDRRWCVVVLRGVPQRPAGLIALEGAFVAVFDLRHISNRVGRQAYCAPIARVGSDEIPPLIVSFVRVVDIYSKARKCDPSLQPCLVLLLIFSRCRRRQLYWPYFHP